MKLQTLRQLSILGIALLALAGCNSKKDLGKIRDLESKLKALAEEQAAELKERDGQLKEKEETAAKAAADRQEKITELNAAIEKATADIATLEKKLDEAEAAKLAAIPKDATVPGHPDFDPGKVNRYTDALATVTGDVTKGTGFLVKAGDKTYLYTAAAVIAGNTKLTISSFGGQQFAKFGDLELAEGSGCARIELLEVGDAATLELAGAVTIGSDTGISSLGIDAGSVNSACNNAFGQKGQLLEVEPTSLVGKAGGPVLATATAKVLAVIVKGPGAQPDLWTDPATSNQDASADVGMFQAVLLNDDLAWQAVPLASFLAEGRKIAEFDKMTRLAHAIGALKPSATGLGLSETVSGSITVGALLAESKGLQFAAELIKLDEGLTAKTVRLGAADLKKRYLSIVSSGVALIKRSEADFDPAKFSSYHRPLVEQSLKWRKEATRRTDDAAKAEITQPTKPKRGDRDNGGNPAPDPQQK